VFRRGRGQTRSWRKNCGGIQGGRRAGALTVGPCPPSRRRQPR
jgi:hypothetical protein